MSVSSKKVVHTPFITEMTLNGPTDVEIVTRTSTQPSDWRLESTNFNIDGRYSIDKVDIFELFLPVSRQQSKQVVVLKFLDCAMLGCIKTYLQFLIQITAM